MRGVQAADHLHVHARRERLRGRLRPVGGDAVIEQLADRLPVADDEPVEPPLLAQHLASA